MKLSELSTDRAVDVLCEMTPYILNLVGDKALLDALREKMDAKGKSAAEIYAFGAKKVSTLAPIVLKDHKSDVFGLLSVLNDKPAKEIAAQNIMTTMGQIKEAVQDKELVDFFKSWGSEESE